MNQFVGKPTAVETIRLQIPPPLTRRPPLAKGAANEVSGGISSIAHVQCRLINELIHKNLRAVSPRTAREPNKACGQLVDGVFRGSSGTKTYGRTANWLSLE
jgi:hypothetical protein